jgi:prepilin-type N-terminal cleavage/methylation domain-containing protein
MKRFRALQRSNEDDGFTLLELIITVVIIGVLTAIGIPAYGAIQDAARQAAIQASVNNFHSSVTAAYTQGGYSAALAVAERMNAESDIMVFRAIDIPPYFTSDELVERQNLEYSFNESPEIYTRATFKAVNEIYGAVDAREGDGTFICAEVFYGETQITNIAFAGTACGPSLG